jgi:hypothetical protein
VTEEIGDGFAERLAAARRRVWMAELTAKIDVATIEGSAQREPERIDEG